MKRYFSLLLLAVFMVVMGGCSSLGGVAPKVKMSNRDMIAHEGGSTVALMMYDDSKETTKTTGYRPFCTGVWVDETHIVTADHCAKAIQKQQQKRLDARKEKNKEEPKTLQELLERLFGGGGLDEPDVIEEKGLSIHYILEKEVTEVNKEPSAWHLSKVVAFDSAHDLALLEAQGNAIPKHRVAKVASATPEIGEHVNMVGQPVGMYWTYIDGKVSAYRGEDMLKGKDDKGPWMQVAAPIYFGNSGGGCFNDYGELVGIADWIKDAPLMSFFIHVDTIRSFLDSNLNKKK